MGTALGPLAHHKLQILSCWLHSVGLGQLTPRKADKLAQNAAQTIPMSCRLPEQSTTPPQLHIIISCHRGEDEESLAGPTVQFAISSSGRWDESARPREGRNEYKAAAEDGNLSFDMDFYSSCKMYGTMQVPLPLIRNSASSFETFGVHFCAPHDILLLPPPCSLLSCDEAGRSWRCQ